jgi:hypothetical protein
MASTNSFEPSLVEAEAVRMLCAAGFDAFHSGSEASLRGGVAVRVSERDARLAWSATRSEPAPVDHNYSSYAGGVILHGGRVLCDDSAARLQDFVTRLIHGAARCAAS